MHTLSKRELAEVLTIIHLIKNVYPKGIVSIVADTFDFWALMGKYLPILKPYIEARDGKVVFRPDSGNPVDIICGTKFSEVLVEQKGAMECLYDVFGYTTNEQGYKHLNPKVGLIYGDSITLDRQEAILRNLAEKKYATDCIVLGVGSYSLCMNSRDTLGFAMKATYTEINGQGYEIYKDPKTGDGTKTSAKGLLVVENTLFGPALFDQSSRYTINKPSNLLQPTFQDGKLLRETSLSEIRALLHP